MNWILIRGLARDHRHWGHFPRQLAARTGGEVHCIDLPGAGTSKHLAVPGSLSGFVDAIRPQLPKTGGRWGVFGMSLGGMTAVQWAAMYPEDFEWVAVGNSSAANLSPFWKRLIPRNYYTLLTVGTKPPIERERGIMDMIVNHPVQGTAALAEEWASFGTPVTRKVFLRQLMTGARSFAPAALKRPVLVMSSNGDRFVNPDCSRALFAHVAQITTAEQAIHPTAGHDLAEDAPDWVMDQLLAFVGRHSELGK